METFLQKPFLSFILLTHLTNKYFGKKFSPDKYLRLQKYFIPSYAGPSLLPISAINVFTSNTLLLSAITLCTLGKEIEAQPLIEQEWGAWPYAGLSLLKV